jgi:hypothetical protein
MTTATLTASEALDLHAVEVAFVRIIGELTDLSRLLAYAGLPFSPAAAQVTAAHACLTEAAASLEDAFQAAAEHPAVLATLDEEPPF